VHDTFNLDDADSGENREEVCGGLQTLLRPDKATTAQVTKSICVPNTDDHPPEYDVDVLAHLAAVKAPTKEEAITADTTIAVDTGAAAGSVNEVNQVSNGSSAGADGAAANSTKSSTGSDGAITEATIKEKLRRAAELSNAMLASLVGLIDYRDKKLAELRGTMTPRGLDRKIEGKKMELESAENGLKSAREAAATAQGTLDLATGKKDGIQQNDPALSSFTCANASSSPNDNFKNACIAISAADGDLKTKQIDEKSNEKVAGDRRQELKSLRDQRAIWLRLAANLRQSLIAVIDEVFVEHLGRRERANLDLERAVEVMGEASGAVAR